MTDRRSDRPGAAAVAVALASLALAGCLARPHHFHAIGERWTAEIDDLTGRLVAAHAEAAPPAASLRPDAVTLRNLDPERIEVGWLAPSCLDSAFFDLFDRGGRMDIEFEIGACADSSSAEADGPAAPGTSGFAMELRFDRPVDATAITARPAEVP